MATATLSLPPVTLPGQPFRMSLDVYHRMGELGLLKPSDRVVLLDGVLVRKMTEGPRHAVAMEKSSDVLDTVLPAGWHVRHENPITLPTGPAGAASEPEPDVAVVRGAQEGYTTAHPGPADCALVVEVADSSMGADRLGLGRYA